MPNVLEEFTRPAYTFSYSHIPVTVVALLKLKISSKERPSEARKRRRYKIPDSCLLPLTMSETPTWRSPPGLHLADNPRETRRLDEMVYLHPVR